MANIPSAHNRFPRSIRHKCVFALLPVFLLSFCPTVLVGQHEAEHIVDLSTPEAQFLELVDLVADPTKQLELLDTFLVQFPKYEGVGTLYAQMQDICVNVKNWDRALALGDKLLVIDESDIEAVRLNLKAAEGKNDAALIAKWSERLKQLEPPEGTVTASSTILLPFVDEEPAGDIGAVDLSSVPKQHKGRVEAILFNRALQEQDPKRKLQLLSLFEKEFPNSAHLTKVRYMFFLTHRDREDHVKALAAAEAVLERDKFREDVLFYAAQSYFVTKRDHAKVIAHASAILDLVKTKTKPDNISDEQWHQQKEMLTLNSHWMIGTTRLLQEQWPEADKSLRAALTTGAPGPDMMASIFSSLGWTNYKLRNIPDALKFYERCAAIPSGLRESAKQSIVSIKVEYNLQ